MFRLALLSVALAVAPAVRAADPPTKEELADIRQQVKNLSVYVFSPADLLRACKALAQHGPKASAAVPALVAVIDSPDHKSDEVRTAATFAIADIGGPDAVKALTALAKHSSAEIREAARRGLAVAADTARPDPKSAPHAFWESYLPDDATAVIDLRLRSLLDLLPVRRAVTDEIREALTKSGLAKAFKVDVLRDVTDAAFVYAGGKAGVVVLGGRFDDAPKGKVVEFDGFGLSGFGLCVSNAVLLLSDDRDRLEKLAAPARKVPPVPVWVTKQLPVRASKPVVWAATDGELVRPLVNLPGVKETPAGIREIPGVIGVSAQLDIGPQYWTVKVRVLCGTAEDAKTWADVLDKLRQLAVVYLPFLVNGKPDLKALTDDLAKALRDATPRADGASATLAIGVKVATVEAFCKLLAGDEK